MRRREFIALLGGGALAWPPAARAQQTGKIMRIGVLMGEGANDPEAQRRLSAFTKGLEQLGWNTGRNISIETRWGEGNSERIRENAAELFRSSPDVILAVSTPAVAAAKTESKTIPTVFVSVSDPVGLGFVTSLAHPGGNITGFANFEPEMGSKWLEPISKLLAAVDPI